MIIDKVAGMWVERNGKGIRVEAYDYNYENCISRVCSEGFEFEGLSINEDGEIEYLYFRKEQELCGSRLTN